MPHTKESFDAIMAANQAEAAARQQARDEHGRFISQAHADREARARGELPPFDPKSIPSLGEIFGASYEVQRAAEAEAERARVAALTPRDLWLSTLSWQERTRIAKWETINKMPYPVQLQQGA